MKPKDDLGGVPIREVPPDWIGRILPHVNESYPPVVVWWARHPDGTYTPVYTVSEVPRR